MEKLTQYFTQAGFEIVEAEKIARSFTLQKIKKGDYFIQEGHTSTRLGFVGKGFVQYFIVLNGDEKTTYSVGEYGFVASLVSFLKQVPSKENIRAVVDSEIWAITRAQVQELQHELPAFKNFYIELLEGQICCIDESRLDAIMLTAQERYEKMLEKEPAMVQQIPLQYLASILGVTPRHLSRIRANIR